MFKIANNVVLTSSIHKTKGRHFPFFIDTFYITISFSTMVLDVFSLYQRFIIINPIFNFFFCVKPEPISKHYRLDKSLHRGSTITLLNYKKGLRFLLCLFHFNFVISIIFLNVDPSFNKEFISSLLQMY